MLIQELVLFKDYRIETLFLAVNLADRFLVHTQQEGEEAPNLIILTVTTLLLAAKVEQPIEPSFNRVITYLEKLHATTIKKQQIVDLEEKILRALNFELLYVSPITFLGRFLRIFGLDDEKENKNAKQITNLSKQFCIFMQQESFFLDYMPSQIAAASLLFSVNISLSDVAPILGIRQLNKLQIESLISQSMQRRMESSVANSNEHSINPLIIWNK